MFGKKKTFGIQIFFIPNKFLGPKHFGFKNILGQKFVKKDIGKNKFWLKKFWVKIMGQKSRYPSMSDTIHQTEEALAQAEN